MRVYWDYTKGFRWLYIVIIVGMVSDGILQSSVVAFLKIVIDNLIGNPVQFIQTKLLHYCLYALAGAALFLPTAYSGHLAAAVLSSKLTMRFRLALYTHLQKLSSDFYQRTQVGEISTRVTADIDQGVTTLSSFVVSMVWSSTMVASSLTAMYFLSWKLFLVFVAMNLGYIGISRYFIPKIQVLSREVREHSGRLNAKVTEDIGANLLVKSFAVEEQFFGRIKDTQTNLYGTQVRSSTIATLFSDILQVLFIFLAPIVILGTGSFLVGQSAGLTVGALVAFWSYWKVIHSPVHMLFNMTATLTTATASMDRVMEFFQEQPLVQDGESAKDIQLENGDIHLDNVDFAYPNSPYRPVLNNFDVHILPRTSVGIVGPSGAGKSTLVQLLLRFYDPTRGRILIDNQDIKSYSQKSLRQQIGVVFQDTILLSGSIRENLLLARENASDPEIIEALKQAEAFDFVTQMGGLEAQLGERGANLSGGQRQRLSIARVFLKNPAIVIFDEATSALDTLTEFRIQEAMQRLLKGRTSIIIAHRISTIAQCDQILVMDDGVLSAAGRHEALLKTSDLYSELVKKQDLTHLAVATS